MLIWKRVKQLFIYKGKTIEILMDQVEHIKVELDPKELKSIKNICKN
jgi:hypothetical protein